MRKVLEGIRVFDLSVHAVGPIAAAMLGDLGADVIKIEHPIEGDRQRGIKRQWGSQREIKVNGTTFHLDIDVMNRSKRGITLDVSRNKGREVAYRLIEKSDVFLTNLRARALNRWGFSYERLKEINPKIIYVISNGLGQLGPEAEAPAFDHVGIARSGFMYVATPVGEEPVYPFGALSDVLTGHITAYATVVAILARERHGVGQKVETSQLGSMMSLQQLLINTELTKRWSGKPYTYFPRYQQPNPGMLNYKCGDGKWLFIVILSSTRWPDFCKAIGRDDLLDNPRYADEEKREQHASELIRSLEETFLQRPSDEWLKILGSADLVVAPYHTWSDVANDPQAIANEYIVEVDHPYLGGKVKYFGFPFRMTETPWKIQRVAPQFGEHTDEVLLEAGFMWDEIEKLRIEKII